MVYVRVNKICFYNMIRKQAKEARRTAEDRAGELELKNKGLEELLATLRDVKGAQKVLEWHTRMEALRLEDLRLRRQNERATDETARLQALVRRQEEQIAVLEEAAVRMQKEFDEHQLQWEQREVELERIITQMEMVQAEIANAAAQIEGSSSGTPSAATFIILSPVSELNSIIFL